MKFTLGWLRDHLDTDATLGAITDTLSRIGLEVEGVEDRGAALRGFRTARILEAVPHPNADRLRVCRVDTGLEGGAPVQVVCGAPNARDGISVIFAPPGTHIPGSGITIRAGEIRGQKSDGMLCSLRELGLGLEHDGIAELPANTTPGQDYAAFAGLDDPVIEIAVTPNRGDALAVRGVARDLAAAGLGRLKPWLADTVRGGFPSPVSWRNAFPEACSWVLGRTVRGVRNGDSPLWLRERLSAVGLRPISALVDITNFFALDLGRPLHVFDADRVAGGVLTLRRGAGETMRALNGRDYVADGEDCVIADADGVRSLAGLMGGEQGSCSADTTTVFIECALFDPVRIALSGRRHELFSDARQRFERGVDQALPPAAIEAATRMVIELCGGEASEVVSAGAEPDWRRDAGLRFERLRGLGGADVPADEAVAALEHLGFGLRERDGAGARFAVPSWRNDVATPVVLAPHPGSGSDAAELAAAVRLVEPEAELVEEVLRLHGLDALPARTLPPLAAVPAAALGARQVRAATARRILAGRGLNECVGFSFTSRNNAARFGEVPDALRLLNPIAADLDQLRPTPLATLAEAAARNQARGQEGVALFELGAAFGPSGGEPGGGEQREVAAGLRVGRGARHPGRTAEPATWQAAKADALAVLGALGVPLDAVTVTADAPAHYHPGRSGVLRQGPRQVLGRFGMLHPRAAAALDLQGPAAAFELFLDRVPEPKRRRRTAPDLSALQPVRRDFAFVAERAVTAESLLRAVRGADRALISGVSLFDVYDGDKVPAGTRSLAVEVVFQPRERSLTDAEIEAASARVVAAVNKSTGAVLRG